MIDDWVTPDWPAPPGIRAVTTSRQGGVSRGPYASMNPADHVGDTPGAVQTNRRRLAAILQLPASPVWLRQVHGCRIVDAAGCAVPVEADGAWTHRPGVVCAVLTADCLPVLLCDRSGSRIAVVHAGWRGLVAGVIEQTVAALEVAGEELLAWLGPAVSVRAYEVGAEVRDAFVSSHPAAAAAFQAVGDRWYADLYQLARQRLDGCGISAVFGGTLCTFSDRERFYSYRRDGVTGRMATLIWLQGR